MLDKAVFELVGAYRCVCVEVTAHVLYLQFQLLLRALLGSLWPTLASRTIPLPSTVCSYLESKVLQEVCGSVGPVRLRPASSIDPDTDGGSLGPRRMLGSDLRRRVNYYSRSSQRVLHTVKPFFSVVDSVLEPYVTGVARPLVKGEAFRALTALMAALLRRLWCRFNASRREAIAFARVVVGERRDGGWAVMGWRRYWELQLAWLE